MISPMHWDLVDPKIRKVLAVLLKNKGKLYHLHQIAVESRVSQATVFRIVPMLVSLNYLTITKIGKLKLYSLADNAKTQGLHNEKN